MSENIPGTALSVSYKRYLAPFTFLYQPDRIIFVTDGLQKAVINIHEELFANKSVAELLTHLFEKKHISKAALAKQAGMSEIYLHQIFAGRRTPSRNRLLCLCYGLEASIEETQELLRLCGIAELYPKRKRDAIIYYGLLHRLDLFTINDRLFDENEDTLC